MEETSPRGAPFLESLEPRVLLSADSLPLEPLVPLEASPGTSVVNVDLDPAPGAQALDLPGLELVDADPAPLAGQIIYLNFDGATKAVYDGPVTVGPFDVPAFQAPDRWAGQEQTLVAQTLATLEKIFAGAGVVFSTLEPAAQQPHSTIYLGGKDAAFTAYGSFLGLAEQVDVGNKNLSDEAWVFSARLGEILGDADQYAAGLVQLIAHEMGHLLGYEHQGFTGQQDSLLGRYAAADYTLAITATHGSVTTNPDKDLYDAGEVVKLMPRPETGYSFAGWSGDAAGQSLALDLTMDANKAVTANFELWRAPLGIPEPDFGIRETYRMYDNAAHRNPALTYRQNIEGGYYTHYVDNTYPGATDTSNPYGTAERPRATVPTGLPEGSVVEIHGGPYVYGGLSGDYHQIEFSGTGTLQRPIFFRGLASAIPIFYQTQIRTNGVYLIMENLDLDYSKIGTHYTFPSHHLSFRNLEVHGSPAPIGGAAISAGNGNHHHLVVYNCHIYNNGDPDYPVENDLHAVLVGSRDPAEHAEYVWIVDNHMHGNGGDSVQVNSQIGNVINHVYIGRNLMHEEGENAVDLKESYNVVVSQNTAYGFEPGPGSDGTAIVVNDDAPHENIWLLFNEVYHSAHGIRFQGPANILGNLVHDVAGNAIYGWGSGVVASILDNTVYNVNRGIAWGGGTDGDTRLNIANNLFSNISGLYLYVERPYVAEDSTMSHNLLYNPGGSALLSWGLNSESGTETLAQFQTRTGQGAGCVEANPRFVDAAHRNFYLQPTSPAIDAGTSAGIVQQTYDLFEQLYGLSIRQDMEAKARTGAWDIGAYEYAPNGGDVAPRRTAVASTSYSGLPASNATDGNINSRWSSQFSDNEWIYVDLGSVSTISRVVLRWEAAYGRGYRLQVSDDASMWSDVYSTTTGDGGVDDITLSVPASGRYVRMLGSQRATMYGYSLWEFEVYGGSGGVPEITVLGNGVPIADDDATPSATDGTNFGSVAQGGPAISRTFTVRNDGTATLTLGAVAVPAGFTLMEGLSSSLAPGASETFTVRLDAATMGTKAGDLSFSTNDRDENPLNFRITGTIATAVANLALGKTAVASTSYSGLPASNVTDGNINSRWSSQFSDSEWIYVDLGSVCTINRVVLRWETAYGRGYKIQVSSDASTLVGCVQYDHGRWGCGRHHAGYTGFRPVRANAGHPTGDRVRVFAVGVRGLWRAVAESRKSWCWATGFRSPMAMRRRVQPMGRTLGLWRKVAPQSVARSRSAMMARRR